MLKVLHIIDSGGLYGAEMVLLNLVAEQIKLGLDPTIASIGEKNIKEKSLETEALKRGFKVKKFRMFPGPNIAGALEVLRFAHQEGFDLMHSHGYKGNVAFGFMSRKFRKIPLIATAHGWTSTKGLTKNRIYEWLDTLSFKFIDAVVLVSNAMKSHPKLKNLNSINFHVIPNGIPIPDVTSPPHLLNPSPSIPSPSHLPNTSPSVTSPSDLPNTSPSVTSPSDLLNPSPSKSFDKKIIDFCQNAYTIGSIGRLSTEKGYKYLIEALSLLIKNGIDARLIIFGEGYERDYLEYLITKFKLTERVMLPGYRAEAKEFIPYFNVFALSSLTEGLPITILEAMQAKAPIIATRVGGIPEVLQNGDAGLLVKPYNPEALIKEIIKIHNNGKFTQKLVEAAYQRVITNYSSEAMAQKYLDLYSRFAT